MIWLAYIVFGFLVIRFLVSLSNLLSRPLLHPADYESAPKVSILIPARNEEHTLRETLQSVLDQDYENFEVVVMDDQSTDGTLAIAQEFAHLDARFRVENGQALPPGWLGKNRACHQLAKLAKGEFFLFIDSDVVLQKGAIQAGLAQMKKYELSLLSCFPDQWMKSTGEKLVVPIMHHLLLSLLPLELVTKSKNPAFAAANGQFMLFSAKEYRANRWHEKVRTKIVEDIEIMKEVKKSGLNGRVVLGNGLVHCRMYNSFGEGFRGFSKNLLAGFGNSIIGLMVYLLLIVFGWVAFLWAPAWMGLTAVGMALGIRLMISMLGKQPIGFNLFAHPLQMAVMTGIGFRSMQQQIIGKNEWKGRNIHLKATQNDTQNSSPINPKPEMKRS